MSPQSQTTGAAVRAFIARGGHWRPALDPLIESAPDFVEAFIRFAEAPWRTGTLPLKIKELISLALDASATHLHLPGIRAHIRGAIRHGATEEEILEVLQLVSVIGVHACVLGVPILIEKLAARPDTAVDLANDDPQRAALKAEFLASRGYWNGVWDGLLALDPSFFQSFTDFSAAPWRGGVLEPKVKEFVYIAMDISATHQFTPGTHIHIQNALGYGATKEELLEVMQLSSVMGMDTFELALPILAEELLAAEQERAASGAAGRSR